MTPFFVLNLRGGAKGGCIFFTEYGRVGYQIKSKGPVILLQIGSIFDFGRNIEECQPQKVKQITFSEP